MRQLQTIPRVNDPISQAIESIYSNLKLLWLEAETCQLDANIYASIGNYTHWVMCRDWMDTISSEIEKNCTAIKLIQSVK